MSRIRLVGVDHWCRHLATVFHDARPDIPVEVVTPSGLRPSGADGPTVRVGFRPGAATWRGRVFDLWWMICVRRSRRVTYWIGTDVAQAVQDGELGKLGKLERRWRRAMAGRSAVGAPWFVDELRAVGIESDYARFPHESVVAGARPWPEEFSVATYIPLNKPEFYGADVLPAIADRLPHVPIHVYGGGEVEERSNIEQHGFVDDFVAEIERSVVVLRLTDHDAIAGTVREALAIGRYTLFGYDVPGVTTVDVHDADAIAEAIDDVRARHEVGSLAPNEAGIRFAATMSARADAAALAAWILGEPNDGGAPG